MGHILSRALRRLTHCNQTQPHESERTSEQRQRQQAQHSGDAETRPTVQSIPVGQSIDSSDYAAFEASKSQPVADTTKPETSHLIGKEIGDANEDVENRPQFVDDTNQQKRPTKSSNENAPQVEEAVIKIQAYVRGHLTRKALKDAQQQNSTVPLNAIGQSQFDEESLTKNPSGKIAPKLESIAEESQNSISLDRKESQSLTSEDASIDKDDIVNKGVNKQNAPSNRGLSVTTVGRESVSPVPSEAAASIDLDACDTPASASIEISDHCIKPTDKLASVLHFKAPSPAPTTAADGAQAYPSKEDVSYTTPRVVETPPAAADSSAHARPDTPPPSPMNQNTLVNSHSIDSAEAAAIRIQSAFRGYHTRKHSPYRRRSPNSAPLDSVDFQAVSSNGLNGEHSGGFNHENNGHTTRGELRQQEATDVIDEDDVEIGTTTQMSHSNGIENGGIAQAAEIGRRLSRQRQRDASSALDAAAASIEESLATSDGSTIIEARPTSHPSLLDNTEEVEHNRKDETQFGEMDETGLTSTIESILADSDVIGCAGGALEDVQPESLTSVFPRSSLDAKSGTSTEFDTDSSNLGAALSLNEDANESGSRDAPPTVGTDLTDGAPHAAQREPSAQQLEKVREQEAALEQAADALEAALEEAIHESNDAEALNQYEQHAIELESDDIERRDPQGHVTEVRSKPQQMQLEQSQSALMASIDHSSAAESHQQQRLTLESPDEAFASGPSSPALGSSNAGTSSDEGADSEHEHEEDDASPEKNDQQQEQQQQATTSGDQKISGGNKNKKKNRNKKRGKK